MLGRKAKVLGHKAEHSNILHNKLKTYLGEGLVKVDGANGTKTDIEIGSIRISQKTPSGKSTQVWLPTKNTLFTHVPTLINVKSKILEMLGSPTAKRVSTHNIKDFNQVLEVFNQATRDGTLPNKMFLQVNSEDPVQYISWVKKTNGGGGITVIDAKIYVDYIIANGVWIAAPKGTTLWLIDKNNPNKKFAHLQRKGSPSKDKEKDGQYYSPLFHIHEYWPVGIVGKDISFKINGI